ncbi:hypothetical protein Tco_0218687 [Tanacetum coccineum]
MIDFALWEVIENGNTAPKTIVVKGVEKVIPPTNAEEKDQKRLEVKARKKRFGGNAATKKTQNLLSCIGAFRRNDFTRRCEPEAIKEFVI